MFTNCLSRHASIDAATRAARGLPEDLIRLCVGIEDVHDLLDDLERALIDAGAVEYDVSQNRYVRVHRSEADGTIARAIKSLELEFVVDKEWLVSAPGKVILFGEHAVVHGVVSCLSYQPILEMESLRTCTLCPGAFAFVLILLDRLPSLQPLTSGAMASRLPEMTENSQSISMILKVSIMNGTLKHCHGMW